MLKRLKTYTLTQLFVIYTRYLVGGAFVFASLVKIKGERFTATSGADNPINSAWHFFETMYQSGIYWKFIGLGQLVAGALLMTQRYAKLGAVVFLPIIANVFVITISYEFAYTPVVTGLMLLATSMLLVWDWDSLRVLVNQPAVIDSTPRLENEIVWQYTGLALFVFTVGYRLFVKVYNPFIWAAVCLLIGLVGLILGLKKWQKTLKSYTLGK
jgi:hypothetical protein